MKKCYLLFLVLLILSCLPSAQLEAQSNRIEQTQNGQMYFIFKSESGDSTVLASTNQLMAIFNYDELGLKLIADLKTFHSAHPVLDSLLNTINPPQFQFKANLKFRRLTPPEGHVEFPLDCTVDFNQISRFVSMQADLYKVSQTNRVRARMRLRGRFSMDEMGIGKGLQDFNDEFYIEMYQPLMKPDRYNQF